MKTLQERAKESLGIVTNNSLNEEKYVYTQQECMSACLQRVIVEQCSCLDPEHRLPFKEVDGSHLCYVLGLDNMGMFLEPERYEKQGCFKNTTQFMSDKCSFLHKIINDFACVKKVKDNFGKGTLSGSPGCKCAPSCYTYEYQLSASESPWPSPGYELINAMDDLVLYHDWKYNFGASQEFKTCGRCAYVDCKGGGTGNLRFVSRFKVSRLCLPDFG